MVLEGQAVEGLWLCGEEAVIALRKAGRGWDLRVRVVRDVVWDVRWVRDRPPPPPPPPPPPRGAPAGRKPPPTAPPTRLPGLGCLAAQGEELSRLRLGGEEAGQPVLEGGPGRGQGEEGLLRGVRDLRLRAREGRTHRAFVSKRKTHAPVPALCAGLVSRVSAKNSVEITKSVELAPCNGPHATDLHGHSVDSAQHACPRGRS